MEKEQVIDASAMLAYFRKEHDYEKMNDLLFKASNSGKNLLINVVNWGEVYYILAKTLGLKEAEYIVGLMDEFPITLVPADHAIAMQAAKYKVEKRLSYVDGFTAATAKIFNAALVTADHDFKIVRDEIEIIWINK